MIYTLFACAFMQQSTDFSFTVSTLFDNMNFQLVLGGPFLPCTEQIVGNKAMSSPVLSASDMGY